MPFLSKDLKSNYSSGYIIKQSSGQALLIILLLLAVVLTVTLSIVSRSITEVNISTYQDESVRALNAAEAGIESAILNLGSAPPGTAYKETFDNQASYESVVGYDSPTANDEYAYENTLLSGQSAFFWLVSHDASGKISCSGLPCSRAVQFQICWGTPGTSSSVSETPAVEVSVYYDNSAPQAVNTGNYSDIRVSTKLFDPNNGRLASNNAALARTGSCTLDSKEFAFQAADASNPQIQITNSLAQASDPYRLYVPCRNTSGCMLGMSVKVLYNQSSEHSVGIKTTGGGANLPNQGYVVSSVGVSGDSTRKIDAFQSFPIPFDFASGSLNVQNGISK